MIVISPAEWRAQPHLCWLEQPGRHEMGQLLKKKKRRGKKQKWQPVSQSKRTFQKRSSKLTSSLVNGGRRVGSRLRGIHYGLRMWWGRSCIVQRWPRIGRRRFHWHVSLLHSSEAAKDKSVRGILCPGGGDTPSCTRSLCPDRIFLSRHVTRSTLLLRCNWESPAAAWLRSSHH